MNYLVSFGDSWPSGADLDDPINQKYSALLAKKINIPLLDFAQGSTSVQHLVLQFQQFVDTKYYPGHRYHAVFFLTSKARIFLYENNTDQIMHCSPQNAINERKDQEVGYYRAYNSKLGDFNLNTTVLALQRLCSIYGINDYYTFGWETVPLWKSVDAGKFYSHGEFAITKEFYPEHKHQSLQELVNNKNSHLWTPAYSGHPTESGHEKIANALEKMIKIIDTD
jgi:hypothetical protein